MLANCIFADRILSEYGVCEVFERSLLWKGVISTGFCFSFMNMIFSDFTDFTFFAMKPSYKELHPPERPLFDAGLCIGAHAGLCEELRRLFQRRLGGFSYEKVFSSAAATLGWSSFASRRS